MFERRRKQQEEGWVKRGVLQRRRHALRLSLPEQYRTTDLRNDNLQFDCTLKSIHRTTQEFLLGSSCGTTAL